MLFMPFNNQNNQVASGAHTKAGSKKFCCTPATAPPELDCIMLSRLVSSQSKV